MDTTRVTSKGQVTIPQSVRQKLGIRKGSQVTFTLVGDHLELHLVSSPADTSQSGFGLLKSQRPSIAADCDPASLLDAKEPPF